MKMTMYQKIEWKINVPTRVTLSFDEPRISDNKNFPDKKNIWYGIKQSIDGSGPNGFNATPNLKTMIDMVGAKAGDEIVIEKCQGEKFAYFTVNGKTMQDLQSEAVGNVNIDTTPPAPAPAQATYVEPDTKPSSVDSRLDNLAARVKVLEKDDGIPF